MAFSLRTDEGLEHESPVIQGLFDGKAKELFLLVQLLQRQRLSDRLMS